MIPKCIEPLLISALFILKTIDICPSQRQLFEFHQFLLAVCVVVFFLSNGLQFVVFFVSFGSRLITRTVRFYVLSITELEILGLRILELDFWNPLRKLITWIMTRIFL